MRNKPFDVCGYHWTLAHHLPSIWMVSFLIKDMKNQTLELQEIKRIANSSKGRRTENLLNKVMTKLSELKLEFQELKSKYFALVFENKKLKDIIESYERFAQYTHTKNEQEIEKDAESE